MSNTPTVNKTYYEKNKRLVYERNVANRQRNRDYVRNIKESTPCTDCGKFYPFYVMDFDHIGDDKEHNIAVMVNRRFSIEKLQSEIDKCEVVCANCHRQRTYDRTI